MESQEQASHPFHRPWKSRKPGVIPTFPQLRRLPIYRDQKQNPDLRPKPRGWAKLNCRSGPNTVAKRKRPRAIRIGGGADRRKERDGGDTKSATCDKPRRPPPRSRTMRPKG